jgi:hypothetical protein
MKNTTFFIFTIGFFIVAVGIIAGCIDKYNSAKNLRKDFEAMEKAGYSPRAPPPPAMPPPLPSSPPPPPPPSLPHCNYVCKEFPDEAAATAACADTSSNGLVFPGSECVATQSPLNYDSDAAKVHTCTNDVTQYPAGTFDATGGVFVSSSNDDPEFKNAWEQRFHGAYCEQYGINKEMCTLQMCTHQIDGEAEKHRHFCYATDAEPECKALRVPSDSVAYRYYSYGFDEYADRECDCTDFVKDPPSRSFYNNFGILKSAIDVLAGNDWCPVRFGCALELDAAASQARAAEIAAGTRWFSCFCTHYAPPSAPTASLPDVVLT